MTRRAPALGVIFSAGDILAEYWLGSGLLILSFFFDFLVFGSHRFRNSSEIHQILILDLPNSFPQAVWGFMARLAAGRKRRGTRRRGTRTWWGRDAPTTAFAPAEIFPVYRQVIPSHSKSS